MKKMALAAAIWLTVSVQAEELQSSYLCVAEQATGFIFDAQSDRWNATRFNIENGRYVLKLHGEPSLCRRTRPGRIPVSRKLRMFGNARTPLA